MKYEELDDAQKEKARDWYREASVHDDWYDFVYEDAIRMGALMGIEISTKSWRTTGGRAGNSPAIYFSGFCSQGDGACFEGEYRYQKGGVQAVTKECGGQDKELIRIAQGLQGVQKKYFYRLLARCQHRGHYYHSGCMRVEVEHRDDSYRDVNDAEAEVTQLLRDFADWIYGRLEAEYDYLNSDEQVEESILANEYDFDTGNGGIRI